MGIYMGVRRAIRFLVVKAMSGRDNVLLALLEYARWSDSVGVIANRYGIEKGTLKTTIERLKSHAGNHTKALSIAEKIIPEIIDAGVEKVVQTVDFIPFCKLCKTHILNTFPEDHLIKRHKEEVEKAVTEIIERIRSKRALNSKAVSA